eukprot:c12519_g1_i2.p1 GENE.c12519_g1_i2~~c12519_g1_i2.p1  ORF type:complete len:611 (+),score=106.02 c12519_g1_i2:183-1835(+)
MAERKAEIETKLIEFKTLADKYAAFAALHIVIRMLEALIFAIVLVGTPLAISAAWIMGGWHEEALWLVIGGSIGTGFAILIHLALHPFDVMYKTRQSLFQELQTLARELLMAVQHSMETARNNLEQTDSAFKAVLQLEVPDNQYLVQQPIPKTWAIAYPFLVLWSILVAIPSSLMFDVRAGLGIVSVDPKAAQWHLSTQSESFIQMSARPITRYIFSYLRDQSEALQKPYYAFLQQLCESVKKNESGTLNLHTAQLKKRARAMVKVEDEYLADSTKCLHWASSSTLLSIVVFFLQPCAFVVRTITRIIFRLDKEGNKLKQANKPELIQIEQPKHWLRTGFGTIITIVVTPFSVLLLLAVLQITLSLNLVMVLVMLPVLIVTRILLFAPMMPYFASDAGRRLGDVLRAMVVCENLSQLVQLHQQLIQPPANPEEPHWKVIRFKNRFMSKEEGFVEMLYNIQHFADGRCGIVCELQVTHIDIFKLRGDAHGPYKLMRAQSPVTLYNDLMLNSRTELKADVESLQHRNQQLASENQSLRERVARLELQLAQIT